MDEIKKTAPAEEQNEAKTLAEEELDNVSGGGGGCSRYGCRECGLAFSTKDEMVEHFKVAHGTTPPEA